ncbi:MAG: hypothetical protein HZT40_05115 [Candidatus Thiothrix singaporensis]|uniref:Uncharacterized protein n=1 Tax=Candidatus Thiothrix singaporensis TaxID=2799669 RepID=A0A7L6APP9_9GAMM|nr:MAG: hypothetical protein HZT40_05115 [Candidatus Thiothrix singaporensis]
MNPIIEAIKYDDKFPSLFRQGARVHRPLKRAPQMTHEERMWRWRHRLEQLFARQEY